MVDAFLLRLTLVTLVTLVAGAPTHSGGGRATESDGSPREFSITARRYSFSPQRIEVAEDDLVKIELYAEDIPHSFTVDSYRIIKRAAAGQRVTFEFRADRSGTFPFYCNLATDERCRSMRGELMVQPR